MTAAPQIIMEVECGETGVRHSAGESALTKGRQLGAAEGCQGGSGGFNLKWWKRRVLTTGPHNDAAVDGFVWEEWQDEWGVCEGKLIKAGT